MRAMKIAFATCFAAVCCGYAYAQAPAPPPQPTYGCDTAESKQLDFWVGEWELTTLGPPGAGVGNKSRNRITKIMDGCAVLEQFTGGGASKLNGHSVSAYDRATKQWKQTWVDNTASYLDFVGGVVDGNMSFWREADRQGKKVKQRMVWKDVKADSLKWLWQSSADGGTTWSTQWEIDYRRLK
jgi:hypothetical protein